MKGFIKTLEAVLGVILIVIPLFTLYTPQRIEEQLSDIGYNCLKDLDNKNLLKYYAINNMNTELNNSLRDCLPYLIEFNFKICKTSVCSINVPENKTVFLSSYIIAGYETVDPTLINLWLWSK